MQRHLLAHFQIGAFSEKDRHNWLCRGVKGGLLCGLGLRNFSVNPAFHQLVHMAVLHFKAMFAKLIDKAITLSVLSTASAYSTINRRSSLPCAVRHARPVDQALARSVGVPPA